MNNNYNIIANLGEVDYEIAKYNLVTDSNFQNSWTELADALGFVSDFRGTRNITIEDSNYILHKKEKIGKNDFRLIVSDIKFEFLPETISIKNQSVENLTPESLLTTTIKNETDSTIKSMKNFAYTTQKKTSVSSSHKIANSLSVKKSTSAKIFSSTLTIGVNFKFSDEHAFGNQEIKIESTQFTDIFNATIPPKSIIPINLVSYKTKIKTSFRAKVKVFYNITIKGPFDKNYTANRKLSKNIGKREVISYSYTFGNKEISAAQHLKKQYTQNEIPEATEWDWKKAGESYIGSSLPRILSILMKDFAMEFYGVFEQEDGSVITIEAGQSTPV